MPITVPPLSDRSYMEFMANIRAYLLQYTEMAVPLSFEDRNAINSMITKCFEPERTGLVSFVLSFIGWSNVQERKFFLHKLARVLIQLERLGDSVLKSVLVNEVKEAIRTYFNQRAPLVFFHQELMYHMANEFAMLSLTHIFNTIYQPDQCAPLFLDLNNQGYNLLMANAEAGFPDSETNHGGLIDVLNYMKISDNLTFSMLAQKSRMGLNAIEMAAINKNTYILMALMEATLRLPSEGQRLIILNQLAKKAIVAIISNVSSYQKPVILFLKLIASISDLDKRKQLITSKLLPYRELFIPYLINNIDTCKLILQLMEGIAFPELEDLIEEIQTRVNGLRSQIDSRSFPEQKLSLGMGASVSYFFSETEDHTFTRLTRTDALGQNPIELAAVRGNTEILLKLLQNTLELSCDKQRLTILNQIGMQTTALIIYNLAPSYEKPVILLFKLIASIPDPLVRKQIMIEKQILSDLFQPHLINDIVACQLILQIIEGVTFPEAEDFIEAIQKRVNGLHLQLAQMNTTPSSSAFFQPQPALDTQELQLGLGASVSYFNGVND